MRTIYLDLETTGVPPLDVHICQFGAVLMPYDGKRREVSQWFRLPDGVEVSPEAYRVNGLCAEVVNDNSWRIGQISGNTFFGTFSAHLLDCCTTKKPEPYAIAGHNIWRYDWPVLKANALRYGVMLPEPAALIDTKLLYAAWLLGLKRDVGHDTIQEWYAWVSLHARSVTCDLDTLARIFGVEIDRNKKHDALQDARITMKVCEAMRERLMLEPVWELEE